MPITLPPISRRRFLAGSAAASAALVCRTSLGAEDASVDANRFALLADTHIAGDRKLVARGANMFKNLAQVRGELLALKRRPAATIINGDCAYLKGKTDDYASLVDALKPLREAGHTVHLALGNHDHRDRCRRAIPAEKGAVGPVAERRVAVIESPHANWFVLDSLDVTDKTPGRLGEKQLAWLDEALGQRRDKPALVVLHHHPDLAVKTAGLTDTAALYKLFDKHRHTKAYFFGHTHDWRVHERRGVHLVNLPPVAYVFVKGKPNGWVDAQLSRDGATLQLYALDQKHRLHGKQVKLTWRT